VARNATVIARASLPSRNVTILFPDVAGEAVAFRGVDLEEAWQLLLEILSIVRLHAELNEVWKSILENRQQKLIIAFHRLKSLTNEILVGCGFSSDVGKSGIVNAEVAAEEGAKVVDRVAHGIAIESFCSVE
jgi:hypothetical protein